MLKISELDSIISKNLERESAEYSLIVEAYSTLTLALPTTGAQAHSRLSVLESLRPQLSALSFMVAGKVNRLRSEHDLKYNKDYTRWCSTGTKPSHAAIEAQLYRDDIDLMSLKYVIEDFYKIHEFVRDLIRCLDNMRQSVTLAWKDSNTYG